MAFTPDTAPLWEDLISGNKKEMQQESSRWACAGQRRSDGTCMDQITQGLKFRAESQELEMILSVFTGLTRE
jgi:hypothetical protein